MQVKVKILKGGMRAAVIQRRRNKERVTEGEVSRISGVSGDDVWEGDLGGESVGEAVAEP